MNKLLSPLAVAALALAPVASYANTNVLMLNASGQYCMKSGTCYSPNANSIVSAAYGDVPGLISQGGITLGQTGGVSNFKATTNPATTNDNTQGYAIGSHWLNKSTGVEYVASSVATNAATWTALDGIGLPWVTGQVYAYPHGATVGTLLTTASTVYAYPIFIPNAVTLVSISISSTTGQTGGACHAGMYADTGAGAPGALVTGTDSGALAATGTAVATKSSLSVAINPGWYWLVTECTASSTMPTLAAMTSAVGNGAVGDIGFDTIAHAFTQSSEMNNGVTAAITYGALPATFPSASYALNTGLAIPVVALGF